MKIISWNINSLRSHEAAFRHVIDTEQPDIFCLQEIRVREDQATFPVKGVPFFHESSNFVTVLWNRYLY